MSLVKIISWITATISSLIMLQTLYFKFTAANESVYIFTQLGLEPFGRIGIGVAELVASILLIIPRSRFLGALISVGLMIGAVIGHLTKLGIEVMNDGGYLFALCLIVLTSTIICLYLKRKQLISFLSVFAQLDKNTIRLLRIPFSFFLMPIFILALSQSNDFKLLDVIITFLIIHLLVYPASNGYNSYIDKDESPIGGLEKPPMPTKALFHLTLVMDVFAISLSFILISKLFSVCILAYILASRAYSSKQIRLKKYPFIGFFVVVVFQGAFTYLMCSIGITNAQLEFTNANVYIMLACSLQIAGAYPLTQIYQHKEDYADGVVTLSYKLGYKGTFMFTALIFGICNLFYFLYFNSVGKVHYFYILQLFFIPILVFFSFWFLKVTKDNSEADFKNTMRMNAIAAICMNSCFIILFILNH